MTYASVSQNFYSLIVLFNINPSKTFTAMAKQTLKSSEIEARINELGQQIIDQNAKITALQQQRDEAYKAGPLSEGAMNVVELGRQIEEGAEELINLYKEYSYLKNDKLEAFSTEYHEVLADKQKEVITLQEDLKEAYDLLEAEDTTQQLVEARKAIKQLQSDYNTLAGTLEEKEDALCNEKEVSMFLAKQKLEIEKERDEATKKADLYRTWWKEEEALNEKPYRILQAVFTILDAFDDRIHNNDEFQHYTCIDAVADDVRSTLLTCESLVKGFGAEEKVKLSHKEEITEENETEE